MRIRWPELDVQRIYLSPHPDDVVLSCGGMIWQQVRHGEKVAVVTVFAASPSASYQLSPFAQLLHERWQASMPSGIDFSDPPNVRRAEDIRAFQALGSDIELIHLPLADCIYRYHPYTGEPVYASEEAIFGEIDPVDPAKAYLEQIPAIPRGVAIYSPLGVGHHVDHQLVRQTVDGWGLSEGWVRYYEDYPYAAQPGAVEQQVGEHSGWIPNVIPLEENALEGKIAAAAQYESQTSTFWPSLEAMAAALRAYAESAGGERLWIRAGI